MPIIHTGDIPPDELSGNKRQTMVNGDLGATALTVFQLDVPPGGEIPLHIHPGHEECMLVLEGTLEAVVDDHVEQVGPETPYWPPATPSTRWSTRVTSQPDSLPSSPQPTCNVTSWTPSVVARQGNR